MNSLSKAQIDYVRDVLGIQSWLRADDVEANANISNEPDWRVSGAYPFLVLHDPTYGAAEVDLLKKMLAALQISQWSELSRQSGEPIDPRRTGYLFIFGSQQWQCFNSELAFENVIGQVITVMNFQVMVSHALHAMTDVTDKKQVQVLKAQTWQHLKEFSKLWRSL